jgi:hypothetical protein
MHLLNTIRPTQNQQIVLALIAQNKNKPAKAAASVSTGENMVAARNMLMRLDVISYTPSHAILTTKGEQIAKDYNIIDDSGALTPEGTQLISKLPGQQPPQNQQVPQPQPDQFGSDQGMGGELGMDLGTEPGMEGFSNLFKNIILG